VIHKSFFTVTLTRKLQVIESLQVSEIRYITATHVTCCLFYGVMIYAQALDSSDKFLLVIHYILITGSTIDPNTRFIELHVYSQQK
jgi:hypothetical protein